MDGVFVTSENTDGVAADAHAWTGNQSGVDGIAHGGVGRAGTLGSHVALGGEARHQIVASRDLGEDRALGHRFDDSLQILGPWMEEKMDVGVDESGHQCCRAQINHRGATGMGDRRTSFNNAIAAHQHLAGADERAMFHIEHVGGVEHDGVVLSVVLSIERIRCGENQNEDESSSEARTSEHAPNTSTPLIANEGRTAGRVES